MSVERHLIFQEVILRPSGEWTPGGHCWTVARVAEGSGYWMQGANTRALNAGDGLVLGFNAAGLLRASQLGSLKLQFFTVQPQFLNGFLTVAEWHRLEIAPAAAPPPAAFFTAHEPVGQKFAHVANQSHGDGLAMRCALLQLWAGAVTGLFPSPTPSSPGINKLRDRFHQIIGQMLEAELSGSSLCELAARLHCSERHFSRLFREEFGVPLRARQIELRLQRARQLLADSDAKVINVAYDSGYRHLGLFNAMFKKRFGATPSEWRQQNARKNAPAKTRNIVSRAAVKIALLLATLGVCLGLPALAQTSPASDGVGAKLRGALMQKMSELDVAENVAKVHVVPVSTNSGPHFRVDKYIVEGNTTLPPATIAGIFTNVPAAFGTNVTVDAVLAAAGDLQAAYRERGYMTVVVGLPRQPLTNGLVRVTVTEAPIVSIKVEGNRWFSSNSVMRALPDLRTNILLNAKIFQRELDAANMSRDRTIRPILEKGPEPGTSALTLKVEDRLPWHARLEVNNQATPGTPDMRANFSSQYDNLWGLEHQIGLQYGFSFNQFKQGANYNTLPFDAPQVANYSGYYRMPLGGYPSVQDEVEARPGSFGYNEATHLFNLPAPAGRPELTLYGSRATSDTGVQFGPASLVTPPTNHLLQIVSQDSGDNLTLNENLGGRLSMPLPQISKLTSTLSVGLDFKRYRLVSYNSNNFITSFTYTNQGSGPTSIVQTVSSPQPTRRIGVDYLPLNAGWNGVLPDKYGTTFFNTSANFDPFAVFSKDAAFSGASYSTKARANYVVVQAGADRQQTIYKDWTVKLHADGQWADGPLFSNEQYAMGGVSGVRGYTDGEAYGDEGWRLMIEPQLPPIDIGMFGNEGGEEPCWLRGSVFMDYGEIYLLDPPAGNSGRQKFWGVGWAATANIGTHMDGRIMMAFPLTATPQTPVGGIHIYFGVGAQF
jgi:hemolysin activation/secretion protein/AraC-like DNA-binding protein